MRYAIVDIETTGGFPPATVKYYLQEAGFQLQTPKLRHRSLYCPLPEGYNRRIGGGADTTYSGWSEIQKVKVKKEEEMSVDDAFSLLKKKPGK